MSDETKDKMSLAAAGGFSSLGIVVGVGALWLALAAHLVPGPAPQAVHKRAKIRLTTDSGVCEYKTVGGSGNDVSDKFPFLNKTNGDDIEWTGQDARPGPGHGNPQSVTISFSTSPFTASGPFTSSGGNPAQSGPIASTSEGDYPYLSIEFVTHAGDHISCSNVTDPGVHVNQ